MIDAVISKSLRREKPLFLCLGDKRRKKRPCLHLIKHERLLECGKTGHYIRSYVSMCKWYQTNTLGWPNEHLER